MSGRGRRISSSNRKSKEDFPKPISKTLSVPDSSYIAERSSLSESENLKRESQNIEIKEKITSLQSQILVDIESGSDYYVIFEKLLSDQFFQSRSLLLKSEILLNLRKRFIDRKKDLELLASCNYNNFSMMINRLSMTYPQQYVFAMRYGCNINCDITKDRILKFTDDIRNKLSENSKKESETKDIFLCCRSLDCDIRQKVLQVFFKIYAIDDYINFGARYEFMVDCLLTWEYKSKRLKDVFDWINSECSSPYEYRFQDSSCVFYDSKFHFDGFLDSNQSHDSKFGHLFLEHEDKLYVFEMPDTIRPVVSWRVIKDINVDLSTPPIGFEF